MVKLVLVSGNKRKIEQLLRLLEPEFEVEVLNREYPEIQSDDPCEISRVSGTMDEVQPQYDRKRGNSQADERREKQKGLL